MFHIDGKAIKSSSETTVSGVFTKDGKDFSDYSFFCGTVRAKTIEGKILCRFSGKPKTGKFKITYTETSSGISIKGTVKVSFSRYRIEEKLDYNETSGKFSTPGDEGLLRKGLL